MKTTKLSGKEKRTLIRFIKEQLALGNYMATKIWAALAESGGHDLGDGRCVNPTHIRNLIRLNRLKQAPRRVMSAADGAKKLDGLALFKLLTSNGVDEAKSFEIAREIR